MLKLLELKQRIKAVQNIQTITRTLAAVSATKLSRSRRRAAGLREYTRKMQEILFDQQEYLEGKGVNIGALTPLLKERDVVNTVGLLVITADRGMCGNYNLAACRLAHDFWEKRKKAAQSTVFLMKGGKGERFLRKRGVEILYAEGWCREGVLAEEVERFLSMFLDLFLNGSIDELYAVYTQFYSPLRRLPQIKRLLPVKLERTGQRSKAIEKWYYEPSFREIFDELLVIYLRVQLYDVLLESFASEHGARMITMEEAMERAEKTLADCRVQYNRLRRESITIDLLGVLFASKVVEEIKTTPGEMA